MRTVVLGERPKELDELIARRQKLGLDGFDEIWDGEYHMAPMAHSSHGDLDQQIAVLLDGPARAAGLIGTGAFNLGEPHNFRVPDRALHRTRPSAVWVPTTAIVVEIVSPDDESWQKLDHYAAHGVEEMIIVDARPRSVTWLKLDPIGGNHQPVTSSAIIGMGPAELSAGIDWPPVA